MKIYPKNKTVCLNKGNELFELKNYQMAMEYYKNFALIDWFKLAN